MSGAYGYGSKQTTAADLDLGTAAYQNIGTSGATVPLNNSNITRSGTLTQTANVFLTGTDRRLGIGTASPGAAFEVRSEAGVDAFYLYRGASGKFGMGPGTGTGNVAIFGFAWPDGIYTLIDNSGNWTFPGSISFQGEKTGVLVSSADQTLSASSKYLQVYTGSGGNTWTMPAIASNTGLSFVIKNRGSGNLTVASASGSQIYDTAAQASITVAAGAAVTLINDATYYLVV